MSARRAWRAAACPMRCCPGPDLPPILEVMTRLAALGQRADPVSQYFPMRPAAAARESGLAYLTLGRAHRQAARLSHRNHRLGRHLGRRVTWLDPPACLPAY